LLNQMLVLVLVHTLLYSPEARSFSDREFYGALFHKIRFASDMK